MTARLPSATDYMEALQDPSSCFSDPELAAGAPALTSLGLPRAVSGNVATVFRVDAPGERSWAVRCFVRPLDRERDRYDAIGAHLAGLASTWRVGFELQPLGIRVGRDWWPLLKMAWAPGRSLLSYVEEHLWDGPALAYMADRFAALAGQLRADGVAHGDLQHGNVLVAPGGDLRLVDYDGMYVPALAGWGGTERGHRNYQHPGRENGDFGPELDHFSSWVVYASLAALAVDPLLWGRLDGGEEALLFRHHDLNRPDQSAAFAALEASQGRGVPELGRLLRRFLAGPVGDVPPLTPDLVPRPDPAPNGAFAPAGPAAPRTDRDGGGTTGAGAPAGLVPPGPRDLDRQRSLYEALRGEGSRSGPDRPAPARLAPAGPGRFTSDLGPARTTLVVAAAVAVVVAVLGLVTGAVLGGLVLALGGAGAGLWRLHQLYLATPEATASGRADEALAEPRRAAADAAARVDVLARRRSEVAAAEATAARSAEEARARLRLEEEDDARRIEAELDAVLAGLAERERASFRAEQRARADALVALQAGLLESQLGRHSLMTAAARGVSPALVRRLSHFGVRTAADFTAVTPARAGAVVVLADGQRLEVADVEPDQAAVMTTWRRHVEESVQVKLPTALPPDQVAAIRARHDEDRAALAREVEAAREAARRRGEELKARWQQQHDRVVAHLKEAEAGAAARRVELDRQLIRARKDAAEAEWHLGVRDQEVGRTGAPSFAEFLRQAAGLSGGVPRHS
jgi:hypothetical protein